MTQANILALRRLRDLKLRLLCDAEDAGACALLLAVREFQTISVKGKPKKDEYQVGAEVSGSQSWP